MRLRYKLPIAFALTTLVFAGIVALVAALALRDVYLDRLQDDMSLQAQQFAAVLEQEASASMGGERRAFCRRSPTRPATPATCASPSSPDDGTVLADSQADPATLDNHADRPEVAQALAGHEGRARRESATLKQEEVYVAIPLPRKRRLLVRRGGAGGLARQPRRCHGGRVVAGAADRLGGPAPAHPGGLLSCSPGRSPARSSASKR